MTRTSPSVCIVYASQKGNAQSIAEDLQNECSDHGVTDVTLYCISKLGKDTSIIREKVDCMIFIAATTGDGEPPDSALKLWRTLNKKKEVLCPPPQFSERPLTHISYTLLGLGDTNYTNFCNFGKNLDEQLHKLGAKRFYNCGWADDGTGLELVIEPWKDGLWSALKNWIVSFGSLTENSNDSDHHDREQSERNLNNFENSTDSKVPFEDSTQCNSNGECNVSDERTLDKLSENINRISINGTTKCNIIDESWRTDHVLLQNFFSLDDQLTLPKVPSYNQLTITYHGKRLEVSSLNESVAPSLLPFSDSDIYTCKVKEKTVMSKTDETGVQSVKKVEEVFISLPDGSSDLDYAPGDSVGVLTENSPEDVEYLLSLLAVKNPDEELLLSSTSKRGLPRHLPTDQSSLREIFTKHVDFRCLPKKAMLLYLSTTATSDLEKRCLKELVSREGSSLYQTKVIENKLTFLDILTVFRSCKVDVSSTLEFLSKLLPRPYSLTCTPLLEREVISFTYSITEIPNSRHIYKQRRGICTGMLESLAVSDTVRLYLRNSKSFRLPDNLKSPMILIGPGTGVAPFIGFLRHVQEQRRAGALEKVPDISLFFGCRHKGLDDLYDLELEGFVSSNILTHLHKCYSRDMNTKPQRKYVQHLIEEQKDGILHAVLQEEAYVYVCGDANNMAKDVYNTFVKILAIQLNDEKSAMEYIINMQREKRYLQDVWS